MSPSDPRPSSSDARDGEAVPSWRENRYMDGKYDRGWDMSVEMIAAILLWGGIGWLVDRWLGTAPWVMVFGFIVGNAAGIYLVYVRASADEQRREQRRRTAAEATAVGGPGEDGGRGSS